MSSISSKWQAPALLNVHVCALRSFCAWLMTQGLIASNPAVHLKVHTESTSSYLVPLTRYQVQALLQRAKRGRQATRDYALVTFLVETGEKRGKCVALKLGDIHLSEYEDWGMVHHQTHDTTRRIPLDESTRRALIHYLATQWHVAPQIDTIVSTLASYPASEPLWQSRPGEALKSRTVMHIVKRLAETCAPSGCVPRDTSPSTLRVTFAHNYLMTHPNDIVGLAQALGHSNLATTLQYVQDLEEEEAA